jgi:hypothetical protein
MTEREFSLTVFVFFSVILFELSKSLSEPSSSSDEKDLSLRFGLLS